MKLFYTTSIDDVKLTIAEKNKTNIIIRKQRIVIRRQKTSRWQSKRH